MTRNDALVVLGNMTMRTSDCRSARRSRGRTGAARELEYDLLLDAVRMAIAPAKEKNSAAGSRQRKPHGPASCVIAGLIIAARRATLPDDSRRAQPNRELEPSGLAKSALAEIRGGKSRLPCSASGNPPQALSIVSPVHRQGRILHRWSADPDRETAGTWPGPDAA